MPTVHSERGYRFWFRAGDRHEPPHIHVRGGGGRAKLWLLPGVQVAYTRRYNRAQVSEITRITERKRDDFLSTWYRFFA